MLDLSVKDTARGPKNYHTPYIKNLQGEDNLPLKVNAASLHYITLITRDSPGFLFDKRSDDLLQNENGTVIIHYLPQ